MKITYACEQCGAMVTRGRTPATMRNGPPRFCSQACNSASRAGTGKGRRVTHRFACDFCGKAVETYRGAQASKGAAPRFCGLDCLGKAQRGSSNPSYSGGRVPLNTGYVVVLAPWHPHADVRGYVLEHRFVMEQMIGRWLTPDEVVHHENEVRGDNIPRNLRLFACQADHAAYHAAKRRAA